MPGVYILTDDSWVYLTVISGGKKNRKPTHAILLPHVRECLIVLCAPLLWLPFSQFIRHLLFSFALVWVPRTTHVSMIRPLSQQQLPKSMSLVATGTSRFSLDERKREERENRVFSLLLFLNESFFNLFPREENRVEYYYNMSHSLRLRGEMREEKRGTEVGFPLFCLSVSPLNFSFKKVGRGRRWTSVGYKTMKWRKKSQCVMGTGIW